MDANTGETLNARLSIEINGDYWAPEEVNKNGIRFTSIHKSKQQRFTVIYALDPGPTTIAFPEGIKSLKITASRGFEYVSNTVGINIEEDSGILEIPLMRWTDLRKAGWTAIEEHLHYDRLSPADDHRWLAMLDADGLDAGHFMILKGGMVPGIWSRQLLSVKPGVPATWTAVAHPWPRVSGLRPRAYQLIGYFKNNRTLLHWRNGLA